MTMMGTLSSSPQTPHSQPQNNSDMNTAAEFMWANLPVIQVVTKMPTSVAIASVAIIHGLGLNLAIAQTKVPQKTVSYQDKPKGNQRCDGCANFQPPNACKMVEEDISPQGWCSLFRKKA